MLLALTATAFAADLTGKASIIDGHTLEIHETRIRLWGIGATETDRLCRGHDSMPYRRGAVAANKLDAFRKTVRCSPKDLDQYGRTVASCSVAALSVRVSSLQREAVFSFRSPRVLAEALRLLQGGTSLGTSKPKRQPRGPYVSEWDRPT